MCVSVCVCVCIYIYIYIYVYVYIYIYSSARPPAEGCRRSSLDSLQPKLNYKS